MRPGHLSSLPRALKTLLPGEINGAVCLESVIARFASTRFSCRKKQILTQNMDHLVLVQEARSGSFLIFHRCFSRRSEANQRKELTGTAAYADLPLWREQIRRCLEENCTPQCTKSTPTGWRQQRLLRQQPVCTFFCVQ